MTISAVLLAGGKSSRMGQDKATMLFNGEPLWKIQIELLRRLRPKEIFISAQIDPAWRPVNVEFVPDAQPSRGPLSGITATLARITSDHLLVLGIDMPFMTENYLRNLRGQVEPACGAVPMIDNRAEPLSAIYPREAEREFESALRGDDFSLQPIIRKLIDHGTLRPIQVPAEERQLFHNLNQPQDLTDR